MEMSKENPIVYEDRNINLERWKDGKNWLIEYYKKYLERDDNRDKEKTTDKERRNGCRSNILHFKRVANRYNYLEKFRLV